MKNGKRKTENFEFFSTLKKMSTWPCQHGEHIGEQIVGMRVVVCEIWALFVFRGEALFHRDFIFLSMHNLYV